MSPNAHERRAHVAEFKRLCAKLGERSSLFDKRKKGHLRSAHEDFAEMESCPQCNPSQFPTCICPVGMRNKQRGVCLTCGGEP